MAIQSRSTDDGAHAPVLEATEARQGRIGKHMLVVLVVGLALAFAALLGTWAFRSGDLEAVDPKSRNTVEEQVPVPSNAAPGG